LKRVARDLLPAAVWQRKKQPYRAPGARVFFTGHSADYINDLLSPVRLRRDDIFDAGTVSRLVEKCRRKSAIGEKDDMALVGILSTQILLDRFVNNFDVTTHGSPYYRAADVHRAELSVRR
jgi:asparagine synthase (glutamine-hydrolysing)